MEDGRILFEIVVTVCVIGVVISAIAMLILSNSSKKEKFEKQLFDRYQRAVSGCMVFGDWDKEFEWMIDMDVTPRGCAIKCSKFLRGPFCSFAYFLEKTGIRYRRECMEVPLRVKLGKASYTDTYPPRFIRETEMTTAQHTFYCIDGSYDPAVIWKAFKKYRKSEIKEYLKQVDEKATALAKLAEE